MPGGGLEGPGGTWRCLEVPGGADAADTSERSTSDASPACPGDRRWGAGGAGRGGDPTAADQPGPPELPRDRVDPPEQAGHTTWRLASEPEVGVLWTYAERQPDGSYRRVGGGAYDPATNTWGQGAFDADDMTRAAVVYLRHWRQFGDRASREHAYQLLRGVT